MNTLEAVFDSPLPSAPLAEFKNFTPFPSLYFQTVDTADNVFHVVVLRVTYSMRKIDTDGALVFADEQTPLVETDTYYGEINQSSVKYESDLAPYKPKCDVLLVGAQAHAPDGKPQARWPAGIEIGGWDKTLLVTGPRWLKRQRSGSYRLSEPEPALTVPLPYEFAFGGQNCYPDPPPEGQKPEFWTVDERNPVGCGFMDPDWVKRVKPDKLRAPQIEIPNQPYTGGVDYPVCGFGAIARPWLPRRLLTGTYDEAWKETRWPKLPLDHDYAYWNCAPEDQQVDYPPGGERIVLHNLHTKPRVEFGLPAHRFYCLVRLHTGPKLPKLLNLDTLILDLETFQLIGVYRTLIAAEAGVQTIEACLEMAGEAG